MPLLVLSVGALFAGFLFEEHFLGAEAAEFWRQSIAAIAGRGEHGELPHWVEFAPLVSLIFGFSIAYYYYVLHPDLPPQMAARKGMLYTFLYNKWYFDELYEVITHSAGNSWMFENRMAHVLAGDYTPLSAVDIFVKDLGLVLDTARGSKFPLPLASTAHQMFMQASSAGHGREDDSAVIKIFPGITLPSKA